MSNEFAFRVPSDLVSAVQKPNRESDTIGECTAWSLQTILRFTMSDWNVWPVVNPMVPNLQPKVPYAMMRMPQLYKTPAQTKCASASQPRVPTRISPARYVMRVRLNVFACGKRCWKDVALGCGIIFCLDWRSH